MDNFCNKKPTSPTDRGFLSLLLLVLAFAVSNLNIVLLIDGNHVRAFNRLLSLIFLLVWVLFLYMSFKGNAKKRLHFYLCFWLLNFVYLVLFFNAGMMDLLYTLLFPLSFIFFFPMAGLGPIPWVYFSLCFLMFILGLIVKKMQKIKQKSVHDREVESTRKFIVCGAPGMFMRKENVFRILYWFMPNIVLLLPVLFVFLVSEQVSSFFSHPFFLIWFLLSLIFVYTSTLTGVIAFFKYKPCGSLALFGGLFFSPLLLFLLLYLNTYDLGRIIPFMFIVYAIPCYVLPFLGLSTVLCFVNKRKKDS